MRIFFHQILKNIVGCFSARNILAYVIALYLTYTAAVSGLDWSWYAFTRPIPSYLVFPGVALGGLVPIVVPFALLAIGASNRDRRLTIAAGALGQSAFLGLLLSSFFKAFTGRAHPVFGAVLTDDISRVFRFGLLRGGVFWGWPSSHTTVAFAMAVALAVIYRERPVIKYSALLYALYIGLAVSVSVHWFSDFAAGAIIGTVIGLVVGRSFGAIRKQ